MKMDRKKKKTVFLTKKEIETNEKHFSNEKRIEKLFSFLSVFGSLPSPAGTPYLQRWGPLGAGASISWPLRHESSDPQPRALHGSAA